MSIVLVAFEGAPTVSEEAVQKEKELDEKIEIKIKGIVNVFVHLIIIIWVIFNKKLKFRHNFSKKNFFIQIENFSMYL